MNETESAAAITAIGLVDEGTAQGNDVTAFRALAAAGVWATLAVADELRALRLALAPAAEPLNEAQRAKRNAGTWRSEDIKGLLSIASTLEHDGRDWSARYLRDITERIEGIRSRRAP